MQIFSSAAQNAGQKKKKKKKIEAMFGAICPLQHKVMPGIGKRLSPKAVTQATLI